IDAFGERRRMAGPVAIEASFRNPALLGETLTVSSDEPGLVTVSAGSTLLAAITIRPAGAYAPQAPALSGRPRARVRRPGVRTLDEAAGARGRVTIEHAAAFRRMFPHAARVIGVETVAALAAISYVVGMECPGRDSLLSAIHVRQEPASPRELGWTVSRTD